MSETHLKNIFSSKLISDVAEGMGSVERVAFQAEGDQASMDKINDFLAAYKESKGADQQHGWTDQNIALVGELTRSLTMDQLVEFFAVLEKELGDEEFEHFFETQGVNDARYRHVQVIASVNLMFNPAFKARLTKSVELSREWWE